MQKKIDSAIDDFINARSWSDPDKVRQLLWALISPTDETEGLAVLAPSVQATPEDRL